MKQLSTISFYQNILLSIEKEFCSKPFFCSKPYPPRLVTDFVQCSKDLRYGKWDLTFALHFWDHGSMTHQGTLRICCPNALGASEDVKVDSPLTVLSVFLPYANIREFWLFSSLYSSVVNSEICMCGLSNFLFCF